MFKNHLDIISRNETPSKKAKFWQSFVRSLKGELFVSMRFAVNLVSFDAFETNLKKYKCVCVCLQLRDDLAYVIFRCDICVDDGLSLERFYRDYVSGQGPMLFELFRKI